MAYKVGDMVRIKDIRNRPDYPVAMRLLSGQCGHVMGIIKTEVVGTGTERATRHYYELDTDNGSGLWPEDFLEPYKAPGLDDEQEWIDTVLKLIAEIEGKLDQLKRQLWRKKHYGK
jgi:hypothetical protein